MLVGAEDKGARIFEAPGDKWDREVGRKCDAVALGVQVDSNLHGVVLAMEVEDAIDDDRACSGKVDLAIDVSGAESDGRILRAFEDGALHALVAHGVAALTAASVDDDLSVDTAGGRIDLECAVLELEGAVDRVQGSVQGPADRGGRRIQRDGDGSCRRLRARGGG